MKFNKVEKIKEDWVDIKENSISHERGVEKNAVSDRWNYLSKFHIKPKILATQY